TGGEGHQAVELVVAVATPAKHRECQIDLGARGLDDAHGVPAVGRGPSAAAPRRVAACTGISRAIPTAGGLALAPAGTPLTGGKDWAFWSGGAVGPAAGRPAGAGPAAPAPRPAAPAAVSS